MLFEQSGGNPESGQRIRSNLAFVEKTFSLKVNGSAFYPAKATSPDLAARLTAAGLGEEFMAKIRFYNEYRLPDGAAVLVRAGKNYDLAVVAGLSVGKGRLILVGTNLDAADEPLDKVLFNYIYHDRRFDQGGSTLSRPLLVTPDIVHSLPPTHGATTPKDNVAAGATIDLLPYFDVKKGVVEREWTFDHGTLVSHNAENSLIQSSYRPPAEYDYIIEVTRVKGDAVQVFSRGIAPAAGTLDPTARQRAFRTLTAMLETRPGRPFQPA